MGSFSNKPLPTDVRRIFQHSFLIRTSVVGRHSGVPRTFETTYVWDGNLRLYLSGYPGKRDWIANLASNPDVIIHTVEGHAHYDIPAVARVLTDRKDRLPHIIAFISHWAEHAGPFRCPIRLGLLAISAVSFSRLPFWGPLLPARLFIDKMPCAEIFLSGTPVRRNDAPMKNSRSTRRQ